MSGCRRYRRCRGRYRYDTARLKDLPSHAHPRPRPSPASPALPHRAGTAQGRPNRYASTARRQRAQSRSLRAPSEETAAGQPARISSRAFATVRLRRQSPQPRSQEMRARFLTFYFLLSNVLLDPLLPHLRAVHVALRIGCDPFRTAGARERTLVDVRVVVGNERRHLAVARAADADAALPLAMLARFVRLGVGHVDHVVLIDVHAARPAELVPLIEKRAVLIEDLNPVIRTIGNEEPAFRVHRQRVRRVELAARRSPRAPLLDELAGSVVLDDARVAVSAVAVGDEDVTVRRGDHIGRLIEVHRVCAGHARHAETQQHFAIGAELHDVMTAGWRRRARASRAGG